MEEKNVNHDVYKKPIDKAVIKKDFRGNRYVRAYDTIKIADEAFNEQWNAEAGNTWSEQILDYDIVYYVCVIVTVPGLGKRSAIGGASLRDTLVGKTGLGKMLSDLKISDLQATRAADLYKIAFTDGLKKALSLFQICGEVYTAEPDKMETGADRQSYGKPAKPSSAAKAIKILGSLSEENNAVAKVLMKKHGLKKMSELGKVLDEAGIKVLDDSTIEKFKAHMASLETEKPKVKEPKAETPKKPATEKKKDIPV